MSVEDEIRGLKHEATMAVLAARRALARRDAAVTQLLDVLTAFKRESEIAEVANQDELPKE